MKDLEVLKKLAREYHKALLNKLSKDELVGHLNDKIEANLGNLKPDDIKQLVHKSILLLGEERVLEIMGIQEESPLNVIDSFDEAKEFIVTSVTNPVTLKNGVYLAGELAKHLIAYDELPEIGYLDETLVMAWYKETSYGLAVIVKEDASTIVDLEYGDEIGSIEGIVDEELVDSIVSHINEVNYEGKVQ